MAQVTFSDSQTTVLYSRCITQVCHSLSASAHSFYHDRKSWPCPWPFLPPSWQQTPSCCLTVAACCASFSCPCLGWWPGRRLYFWVSSSWGSLVAGIARTGEKTWTAAGTGCSWCDWDSPGCADTHPLLRCQAWTEKNCFLIWHCYKVCQRKQAKKTVPNIKENKVFNTCQGNCRHITFYCCIYARLRFEKKMHKYKFDENLKCLRFCLFVLKLLKNKQEGKRGPHDDDDNDDNDDEEDIKKCCSLCPFSHSLYFTNCYTLINNSRSHRQPFNGHPNRTVWWL